MDQRERDEKARLDQRERDEKAREDKFAEERRKWTASLDLYDKEHVMGKPFAQALDRSGYSGINRFPLNEFKDIDDDCVLEIDYMVTGVKNEVKYVFVLEVKSYFNDKYFGQMKGKLQRLERCVRVAFEDAPDKEPDYEFSWRASDFDIQNQKIRKFFGRKFVVQPVVAAPFVCEDSLSKAHELKYWCWMRSDQGYDVFVEGKSVRDDLPLPEKKETVVE